jgi:hypothetical protein
MRARCAVEPSGEKHDRDRDEGIDRSEEETKEEAGAEVGVVDERERCPVGGR